MLITVMDGMWCGVLLMYIYGQSYRRSVSALAHSHLRQCQLTIFSITIMIYSRCVFEVFSLMYMHCQVSQSFQRLSYGEVHVSFDCVAFGG